MNTRFLISPAYLLSIALLVAGAVLSGSRYMLIGWMLFLVGVFLNAMTLVILTNREQLRQIRQAHQQRLEQADRGQAGESTHESSNALDSEPESQKDTAEQDTPQRRSEPELETASENTVAGDADGVDVKDGKDLPQEEGAAVVYEPQVTDETAREDAVVQRTSVNLRSAQNMRRLKSSHKPRKARKKSRR
ncbi:MAG: hypothetical protein Q3991_08150 [Rothia sp. (in: high G+C Gram-positive bacteria)]|uniref:hypothetical protein n=1 Tax=Rothia sp. (in: high G+C Gram-positive bacteria) TaxID=1885016 RepID=UPI0026DB8965|nr:hypothetical protein [Rothia sp. (in: high G+C Gram-positive bacteria)]MDO4884902.1 hypothetical protein [Rothia sp. (in: high G+C Gram-positive bacteria)]